MSTADFSFLDSQQVRSLYSHPKTHPAMDFHVQGVRCGRCVEKIEKIRDQFSEIENIRVHLADHRLYLELKNGDCSFAPIVHAIENKGFRLTPIESKNDLVNLNKSEDKKEILRLGLVGALASNIMMFSFAIYFGADQGLGQLFNWLNFALYLPILFYGALPFYQGFWSSLKQRTLSVDGPMTIASVGGFIFSAINLIRGQGSVYFDSISGFLFLILLSRFFQKRLQRKFLSYQGAIPVESLNRVRKITSDRADWVKAEKIQKGDLILIKKNELIPVDGFVTSESALLSTAYLTGESRSLHRLKGAFVSAGSILKSEELQVQVVVPPLETSFSALIQKVMDQKSLQKDSKIHSISDLWAQVLLLTVFFIAVVSAIINWQESPEMALERSLALIVLACPCAMAFGTPLALAFAMRNAFSKGFLIRSPQVFEKILNVKNIVFDKTGTLTGQSLQVDRVLPLNISQEQMDLILSLENLSQNPYAEAIRDYFAKNYTRTLSIDKAQENPGKGVSGYYQGRFYELKSAGNSICDYKTVGLYADGELVISIFLKEKIDHQVQQMAQAMRQNSMNLFILSGDSRKAVDAAAKTLGIPKHQVFAEMTPQGKRDQIKIIPNAMMVGDGVNDALAFQEATVGVAVQGSVDVALRSSDIYILSPEIYQLGDLFQISRNAIHLIYQNLTISLIYNLIGGTAAMMGLINPFVAALLMPVSSGFILLSTWWGSRK